MFSSNLIKFCATFALLSTLFSGCGLWQKTTDANRSQTPTVADDLKSEIPFASKEPEQFQTEIVVSANGTERKTLIARNGAKRRYDFNAGAKNQVTNLETDKNYLLLTDKKIYAENDSAQTNAADDWQNFLTTEWLSEKPDARFEKLETTENRTRYRVRFGEDALSEVLIYVDEQIGLPVKQEFYSTVGEQKTLTYSVEMKNFKQQTDESLFGIPADYRKISAEEFRKILRSLEN